MVSRLEEFKILRENLIRNINSINKLTFLLIILAVVFHLLVDSKIKDLSFLGIKITEYHLVVKVTPLLFAFVYYKIIAIWINKSLITKRYNSLVSELFNHKEDTIDHSVLLPFEFLNLVMEHQLAHEKEKKISLGCLSLPILIPILFGVILAPFAFIYYALDAIIRHYTFDNLVVIIIVSCSSALMILTLLLILQVAVREIRKK